MRILLGAVLVVMAAPVWAQTTDLPPVQFIAVVGSEDPREIYGRRPEKASYNMEICNSGPAQIGRIWVLQHPIDLGVGRCHTVIGPDAIGASAHADYGGRWIAVIRMISTK